MGRPKALLPFDGEPLIVHIVRRLQPLFADVVVVAAPGQPLPQMPVTMVHDDVAYQGPVGGIFYGLQAAAGEAAFVTSCDSAFASTPLISHLVSLSVDCDVVVPRWDGRFQPLLAVYRASVAPLLAAQLANGEMRPVHLFDKVRTRVVDEEEVRRFDADGSSFFNMNSPDDYIEALRRWSVDGPSTVPVTCTVELLGVAQLLAGTRELSLTLPPGTTIGEVLREVSRKFPALSGRVVTASGGDLVEGYACNVNGLEFVRSAATKVNAGDRVMILSADAGG